jgi:hypothetical protein
MIKVSQANARAAAEWCRKNIHYAEAADRGFIDGTANWKNGRKSDQQLGKLGAVCNRLTAASVKDYHEFVKSWSPSRPKSAHEEFREQMNRQLGIEQPKQVVQIGPMQKYHWLIDDLAFAGLTPTKCAILGYLRDLCWTEHDECSPSIPEIAQRLGLHRATVIRNLNELFPPPPTDGTDPAGAGCFLHGEAVRSSGGRNRRSVYRGLLKTAEAKYGVWRLDAEKGEMVVDRPVGFDAKRSHHDAAIPAEKPADADATVSIGIQSHHDATVSAAKRSHHDATRNSTIKIDTIDQRLPQPVRWREPADACFAVALGEEPSETTVHPEAVHGAATTPSSREAVQNGAAAPPTRKARAVLNDDDADDAAGPRPYRREPLPREPSSEEVRAFHRALRPESVSTAGNDGPLPQRRPRIRDLY